MYTVDQEKLTRMWFGQMYVLRVFVYIKVCKLHQLSVRLPKT